MDIVIPFLSFVFFFYLGFTWKKFGILPSISASYYALGKDKMMFWLFCVLLGGGMLAIAGLNHANQYTGFFFASGAGLCFTGTAGAFKENMTEIVHYIGAAVGIGAAFVALGLVGGLWLPGLVFLLTSGVFLILKLKNIIYWIEVLAFVLVIFGLLLLL